ncbi:MAG: glycosyltransferase [Alphaproteobacteria bacterium]|nr:glycosyltransferase [Alphaproteobacteria bacterium]MBU2380545.1 glycosyltransferase [Alphaproteobacteria bacterium]
MGETGASASEGLRPYDQYAARRGLGWGQGIVVAGLGLGLAIAFLADRSLTAVLVIFTVQLGFLVSALWRVVLAIVSGGASDSIAPPPSEGLPRYTVLVALLDEAEVLPQLMERLAAIDYPPDRLDGFLILEAHDYETIAAAAACPAPSWLKILVAPEPEAGPRTKPRALNCGLAASTGDLVTVYDAEDDPDPLQLREAVARFARDRSRSLWALQAPLRIRSPDGTRRRFLDRQFAVEYASLFEVTLPGMARLGMPFPLGGTSNHFRADALKAVGGWDAHNVTEDADLGFRLWRAGGRLGVLSRPTYEPPPSTLADWLPQRTRWLKGFMQTWGVHTRDVRGLGLRGGLALTLTLGASLAAASAHAVALAWVAATVALAWAAGLPPDTPPFALGVLTVGTAAAWLSGLIGARRAGVSYTATDMLLAPVYWSLLSLAFYHALWRLIVEPFAWDKTRHRADPQRVDGSPSIAVDAGREAA